MIEASTQFMVGRLSTESGKCNSFNLDGIFGNDKGIDFENRLNHSGPRCLPLSRELRGRVSAAAELS